MFKDKTLLITGGTGSFGNAVLDRFLDTDIREIRIFSRDEKKQDDMRRLYKNDKIKFYIGDVRDLASIKDAMYGVDYVFHAAALKQVPSCEFFPLEAVKTNVIGTDNVLTACLEANVKKVICLSTDKAVYPVNAMVGRDVSNGNVIQRARNGVKIISIMITWALENAIETADSMKSRGYGLKGRTSFSNYRFDNRDKVAFSIMVFFTVIVLIGASQGRNSMQYFPNMEIVKITGFSIFEYCCYGLFCLMPMIMEITEEIRWKHLQLND